MSRFDQHGFQDATGPSESQKFYDDGAADYDRAMVEENGWIAPDYVAKTTARYLPVDARVLDAGAGTGLVGEKLKALGFTNIDGFDLSMSMLEVAAGRKAYRNLTAATLGEPLPFENASYDAVTASGVFIHNHAPPEALADIAALVRQGGYIILTLRMPGGVADGREKYWKKLQSLQQEGRLQEAESIGPLPLRQRGYKLSQHKVCVLRVL